MFKRTRLCRVYKSNVVWYTKSSAFEQALNKANASPGLKSNRRINFSCLQMFFTAFVLCILILFKLKTECQTIYRKPHRKVTKLRSKFSLILSSLKRALNNSYCYELSFSAKPLERDASESASSLFEKDI